MLRQPCIFIFFFFNDTATTEIYTLSLHDALPILDTLRVRGTIKTPPDFGIFSHLGMRNHSDERSEEHTSELQSPDHLVCRLLLEKKKKKNKKQNIQLHVSAVLNTKSVQCRAHWLR